MSILSEIIATDEEIVKVTRAPNMDLGDASAWELPDDKALVSSQDKLDAFVGKFKYPVPINIHFGEQTREEFYTWFLSYVDSDGMRWQDYSAGGNEDVPKFLDKPNSIRGQTPKRGLFGGEKNQLIKWLKKKYEFRAMDDAINIVFMGNPTFVDCQYVDADGENPTVPLNSWGLAHRIAHAVVESARRGLYVKDILTDEQKESVRPFIDGVLRQRTAEKNKGRNLLSKLLGRKVKVNTVFDKDIWKPKTSTDNAVTTADMIVAFMMMHGVEPRLPDQRAFEYDEEWFIADLMHATFGTMGSARRDQLPLPGEGQIELVAQILNNGELKFKKTGSPDVDSMADFYKSQLEEAVGNHTKLNMVGKTYVI